MRHRIFAFVVASAVAFTVASLPLATPTSASSCDDIKFIFARGSGQSLGASESTAFFKELSSVLRSADPNHKLSYSFYELGTTAHGGYRYPAVAIDYATAASAKISAGKAFGFGDSVAEGQGELESYLTEVSGLCKNTKFVLGGYSQGAMVISSTLPKLDSTKIIYAATFGDPYLYLPEGEGIIPDACRGKNLSDYRAYAPNCRTGKGILDALKPYEPAEFSGKVGLWCNDKDFMCGAGFKLASKEAAGTDDLAMRYLASGHLNYVKDGHFTSAAKTIIAKIINAYPRLLSVPATADKSNRDVIILIDRTASMENIISNYGLPVKRLASNIISSGGRVGLYTYGDLSDVLPGEENNGVTPTKLSDLGADYYTISEQFDHIITYGGGDDPESLLHALLTIMNEQSWNPGATKSIVVLTDSSYHNPEKDGTTLEQVIKRSLEIDPVNLYVIDNEETVAAYDSLTSLSGGAVFTYDEEEASTDYLLGRPSVTFPLDSYSGNVNEDFTFTADVISDTDITKYEWDLDFDGVFETTTSAPTVSLSYQSPISGYLQLKITNTRGESSTASAYVSVLSITAEAQPSITDLSYTLRDTEDGEPTADISYHFNSQTTAAFISVNNTIMGITTEQHLEFPGLDDALYNVTLTPIGALGTAGTPVSITISNTQSPNAANPDSTSSANHSSTNPNDASNSTQNKSFSQSQSPNAPPKILAPNSGKR